MDCNQARHGPWPFGESIDSKSTNRNTHQKNEQATGKNVTMRGLPPFALLLFFLEERTEGHFADEIADGVVVLFELLENLFDVVVVGEFDSAPEGVGEN